MTEFIGHPAEERAIRRARELLHDDRAFLPGQAFVRRDNDDYVNDDEPEAYVDTPIVRYVRGICALIAVMVLISGIIFFIMDMRR